VASKSNLIPDPKEHKMKAIVLGGERREGLENECHSLRISAQYINIGRFQADNKHRVA